MTTATATTTTIAPTAATTARQARRPAKRRRVNWSFITMIALVCFMFFPIYWMFMTAVLPTSAVLSRNPALLPFGQTFSFDAFTTLFTETAIVSWLLQSGFVTLGSALLSTAVAVTAAYAMSRFSIPGQKLVGMTFLMGRVLPGTLLALPFFVLFQAIGLLDTSTAVILANTAAITPLTALTLKGYFDGIPREIDEAALVDGCTRLGVLWRIILPVSVPGLAACFGLAATAAWTDLLFARTLLLSRENWTMPQGIASMISDVEIHWNELMAAGLISIIPVMIVYWFLQPYLVSGMTAGGVKG
ncbi:carbohydrate ABC transporter permease [Leifsonia kafniensis]